MAHTQYWLASALARRGGRADRERSSALFAHAIQTAQSVGLDALVRRIHQATGCDGAHALPDGLSAREVQVLRLVAAGSSNREIGAALHISQHTAANHVRSILLKTGAANRTEAAAYAYRHALARP
jgi:DNA-binding NarL/FixJ family response regulator